MVGRVRLKHHWPNQGLSLSFNFEDLVEFAKFNMGKIIFLVEGSSYDFALRTFYNTITDF